MRELQRVYLELGKKVIVPATKRGNKEAVERKYPTAFVLNMQSLGFMPSQELLAALVDLSYEEFVSVTDDIYSQLVKLAGSRVNMVPMYPDFPEIMMTLSDEQLFVDAIVHYFTMGTWEARFQEKIRINTESLLKLKVIELGSVDDLLSYLPMLANSSVAMSERQKENVQFLIEYFKNQMNLSAYLSENLNMKNKENMTYVIHTLYKDAVMESTATSVALSAVKTSTDVLRVIMAFLGGDYTLASHKHDLKSLKRKDRRFLLKLLNHVCDINKQTIEDASRYQGLWIIVGEILHPGDYASKYSKAYNFFKTMRNDKVRSWHSKVEKAYKDKDLTALLKLLVSRPGEFARRLERTMRFALENHMSVMTVMDAFTSVAHKVDSTILFQLHQYATDRFNNPHNVRTFMIKGNLAKTYVKEDNRESLNFYYLYIVGACTEALIAKYSELEDLGKVYIDPAIEGYALPLKLRTASKQLYTMARGSRVALPKEAEILRMYIWWKNPGHTDLDLTAMFINEDFKEVTEDVSYWHLRNRDINCVHSGDIRSAVNGAAEFIDVPIEKLKEKGVKYVVMTVSSYSSQPFCDLTECFAGIMALDEIKTGARTFDPDKSLIRSDIASDARMNTPMIYDVDKHEMIWLDAPVTGGFCSYEPINTISYRNNFVNAIRGMLYASYPQLSSLAHAHCIARNAEIVDTPEEADVIFSLDKGITPYSVEEINANWL